MAGASIPTSTEIVEVVEPLVRDLPPLPDRRGARQRLAANVALYFHFYPPHSAWSLEGVEVKVPGAVIDLLWCTPHDELVADEIKTGRFRGRAERAALSRQVHAINSGASRRYGDRFLGVREALLLSPATACFVAWDGTTSPLEKDGRWST